MHSVEEAIFLQNIYYWYLHNKRNEKNFYDNRYWTYNSVTAFAKEFVYLSEKQIRNVLTKLETKGLIITGNYNKIAYDRTKWYSVTEYAIEILEDLGIHKEQEAKPKATTKRENCILPNGNIHLTKRANEVYQTGKPIPSLNTDLNTDLNNNIMTIGAIVDTDKGNLFEEVLSAVEVNIYTEPHYRRPAVKTSILPFDEFWLLYNKSNSKAAVKKKYEKIKEADRQKIKEHLPKYILSTPDKIYRKNALTYLNQECWEDEVVVKNDNLNTAENSNYKTPPKNNRLMM